MKPAELHVRIRGSSVVELIINKALRAGTEHLPTKWPPLQSRPPSIFAAVRFTPPSASKSLSWIMRSDCERLVQSASLPSAAASNSFCSAGEMGPKRLLAKSGSFGVAGVSDIGDGETDTQTASRLEESISARPARLLLGTFGTDLGKTGADGYFCRLG